MLSVIHLSDLTKLCNFLSVFPLKPVQKYIITIMHSNSVKQKGRIHQKFFVAILMSFVEHQSGQK